MPDATNPSDDKNVLKLQLIRASLETATTFAKLALQATNQQEIIRYRQKACDAYEDALHELNTATLSKIQLEELKTQIAHLDSILMEFGLGL